MATVPLSRVQSIYTSKEFGPSHRRNPGLLFESLSFCPIEPQDCVSIERRTKGAFPLTLFCENSGYRESQTFHRNTPILIEPSLETVSQQAQTIKFSPSKFAPCRSKQLSSNHNEHQGCEKMGRQETQIPVLALPVGLSPPRKHLGKGRFACPGCSSRWEVGKGIWFCLFVL